MLMKVADLDGQALNWAVACIEYGAPKRIGLEDRPIVYRFYKDNYVDADIVVDRKFFFHGMYDPSGNWAHGGPIMEGMRLDIVPEHQGDGMLLGLGKEDGGTIFAHAETTLKAFCQAYVQFKTGSDEIEIPDELCEVKS